MRGIRQIGFDKPAEFQKGLVIETDIVDLFRFEARVLETILYRLNREVFVLLLSGKTLFLSGGNDFAVDDECRRRIVIEGGNP